MGCCNPKNIFFKMATYGSSGTVITISRMRFSLNFQTSRTRGLPNNYEFLVLSVSQLLFCRAHPRCPQVPSDCDSRRSVRLVKGCTVHRKDGIFTCEHCGGFSGSSRKFAVHSVCYLGEKSKTPLVTVEATASGETEGIYLLHV